MGLLNFIKKQFIDVIQWTEDRPGVLAYRYPMEGMEIQNGAQLVVRETQRAVFINEGKFADSFGPGTHRLTTSTLPVLTYLRNWDKLFESPFKSDVYFFSTREQLEQTWGTAQPITVRDKELGPLRIRAHGIYSYAISDLEPFYSKLVGTTGAYTVDDVSGQLRSIVATAIATHLGGSEIAFIDMAANQQAFSDAMRAAIAPTLLAYGLELRSFYVQSISLPEEVQAHLDKASSMRVVGDLGRYTQFQAADSLQTAAGNPGGVAGAGAGLGAGLAMGQMMAGAMSSATNSGAAAKAEDPIALIEKLGTLLKSGVLTQEEFDRKKSELLARIQ